MWFTALNGPQPHVDCAGISLHCDDQVGGQGPVSLACDRIHVRVAGFHCVDPQRLQTVSSGAGWFRQELLDIVRCAGRAAAPRVLCEIFAML